MNVTFLLSYYSENTFTSEEVTFLKIHCQQPRQHLAFLLILLLLQEKKGYFCVLFQWIAEHVG